MHRLLSLLVPSLATAMMMSCATMSGEGDHAAPAPTAGVAARVKAAPSPADTNPSWLAEVTARIRDASYGFVADGGDFIAEVPERRLDARFDDAGVHIGSSSDPDGTPISVRTVGVGRTGSGETVRGLAAGSPELGDCQDARADPEGRCIPRLEYSSPGLTEWWASTSAGFEQGWEITERPDGDGWVEIDVQVDDADAGVSDAGVWLQGDDGSLLIVNGLAATDANGAEVVARFEKTADGFKVVLEDEEAAYPILVDPTYTDADWMLEGDAGYPSQFGHSVAGVGDTNGDGYDDIAVGVPYALVNTGVVYIFEGSATGVALTPAVTLTGSSAPSYFGWTEAAAGDVNGDGYDDVVVGAWYADSEAGSAFLYLGSAAGLSSSASTTLNGSAANEYFGVAVSTAGDVNGDGFDDVVIGGSGWSTNQGRAYVYLGSSAGLSSTIATTLTGVYTVSSFGCDVSSAGDVNGDGYDDVVVGASTRGYAYVYQGSATGLGSTATTTLTDSSSTMTGFGGSIAGLGDVDGDGFDDVAVGATLAARVYVYYGGSSGTSTTAGDTLGGTSGLIGFGMVAGVGDVNRDGSPDLLVGDGSDSSYTGRAYLFTGSSTGFPATATTVLTGTAPSEYYTHSMGGAGDTNGDGYADIIIGPLHYGGDAGAAWVYLGSATASLSSVTELSHSNDQLALAVAPAGDVNADGYEDIVVGAPGFDSHRGEALVYHGSAAGLSTTAARTLSGLAVDDDFGMAVAGAGDTNADGYDDIVIGAEGAGSYGQAYTYDGSAAGVRGTVDTTLSGTATYSFLGQTVAGAGDVNRDGYADVAVGTYPGNNYVQIYHGSRSGTSTSATTSISLSYTVSALASAGDVDADGYDDLLVGCECYSLCKGQAYLYRGGSSGLSSTASSTITGSASYNYLGGSVASAGDVNADGYGDVIIGARGYSTNSGHVYLYLGTSSGLASTANRTLTGTSGETFGTAVAGAGDYDRDGYDDVMVGAPDHGTTGGVFVYAGGSGGLTTTVLDTYTGLHALGTSVFSADVNGDGVTDLFAADSNADDYAGTLYGWYGSTDADGDGLTGSEDCDDSDPSIGAPTTGYADLDGDTYGDASNTANVCPGTAGYVNDDTDCDDTSAAIHPGAAEVCDASNTDEDCDAYADDDDPDATGQTATYRDADSDGYGGTTVGLYCDLPSGWVATSTDCDDTTPAITGPTSYYADSDSDGYGDSATATLACSASATFIADNTDCNDASPTINPAATEVCDASNTDEDCDGVADDSDPSATRMSTFYTDSDRDGYGGALTTLRCDAASGFTATSTDCNDSSAAISPAATEACDASNTDEDCDGLVDDADPSATGKSTFYADSDSDGYGGATTGSYCDQPSGYSSTSTDCNDAAAAINPGANEVCDASNTDEDCDGLADDSDTSATGKTTFYVDSDGDGYGSGTAASRCDSGSGYSGLSTDCDDIDVADHPGAAETTGNADDEDCDGGEICYVDADGDGYRDSPTVVSSDTDCSDAGEALATALRDCDDTSASVHSGGAEIPGNGIDEDCDGRELCFTDADDDGYRPDETTTVPSGDLDCDDAGEATLDDLVGDCNDTDPAYNPAAVEANCVDPNDYNCDGSVGYADADGDGFAACEECDDTRTAVNPAATEVCNTLDDDCNGSVDDNAVDATVWYADSDGDGYTDSSVSVTQCTAPDGYALATADDCDDTDSTSHPDAFDVPGDAIDQDCDGADAPIADTGDDTATSDTNGSGKDTGCGGCAGAPGESGLGLLVLAGVLVRRRRG